MALSTQQRQILLDAKARGLTKNQAMSLAFSQKQPTTQPKETRFGDVGEDLASAGKGVVSDIKQRGANIGESFLAQEQGKQTALETGAQFAGNVLGAAGDIGFRGIQAVTTPFLKESEERAIEGGVTKAVEATGIPQKIAESSPRTQRNIQGGFGLLEGLTAGAGGTVTKSFGSSIKNLVKKFKGEDVEAPTTSKLGVTSTGGTNKVPVTIDKIAETVNESLVRQSKDTNISPKAREEAAQSALTFQEKFVGLTPDVKTRLQEMGPEKLQEYFDAAHIRNIDDTAPTPSEVGNKNVGLAEEQLTKILQDTGKGIGKTREKLGTFRLQQTQVDNIDRIFKGEIEALGLTIKNGQVVKKANAISPTSGGDIKAMNSLLEDLNTFKQSPTLTNAIDLRKNFDSKVKFGKRAAEVSNEVDPVSRTVRKIIAEEAAITVGKQNAKLVTEYSDFIDSLGDLRSFTKRQAGAEYLLRLVLSGRGGEARKLIETIKEHTGIDLMNDATAMKVATQTLGNENTQNLFKQEISRAGFDVANVLGGGTVGVAQTIFQRLLAMGIDAEEVLKKAASGTAVGAGALVLMEENPDFAVPLGFAIGSVSPTARKKAVKTAAKLADSNTLDDMFDFNRVVKEGGVKTNNKGELTFNEIEGMSQKQVRNTFQDGLRTLEIDESVLGTMGDKPLSEITKYFDEVIELSDKVKAPNLPK